MSERKRAIEAYSSTPRPIDGGTLSSHAKAREHQSQEYASFLAESEEDDVRLDPWLAILIAPGSSLGGARPKASVIDPAD